MIPMIGTIKSAVKLVELDSKWQQKKDNIGNKIFQPDEQKSPEQLQIDAFQEDLERMRESNDYAMVYNKLKSGKKLSPEEVEYLQKNDPQAYADYKIAQAEKEAFKKKLRNCKTKDEVRELKVSEMGNYLAQAKTVSSNPNIPKSKKLEILGRILSRVMGLEEVYQEFVKSPNYTELDETRLEKKEETTEKKPTKSKDTSEESEISEDTFLGEEYAEIELIYQNVENNATQDAKCDS